MEHWLASIGAALQILGVLMTGVGVRRTWRKFGTEDFWAPLKRAAGELWSRSALRIRQVLHLRRSARVIAGSSALRARTALGVHPRVDFRVIPEDQNVPVSIAELDLRTRGLLEHLQQQAEDSQEVRTVLDAVRTELDSLASDLHESDRQVAIGGIRLEAAGLLLIGLGAVLQVVGALAG